MLQKTVTYDAWDFDLPTELLPIRAGKVPLGSGDRRMLAKRADEQLLSKLSGIRKQPGEELIHLLAIGSNEWFGPNRNFDAFGEEACRRRHPTFVKHALFYRNHRSTGPEASYGLVKLSHYSDLMHRIELVAALNAEPAAARRNGGQLADLEMQKLASGHKIPVSMGASLPFDICSACGHKSFSRAEYCDESMCKVGGMKNNLGRMYGDGEVIYAHNTEPTFNDISHITGGRQADRIALVTGALHKLAGVQSRHIGGAELTELLRTEPGNGRWSKLADMLATTERQMRPVPQLLRGLPYEPLRLPEFPLEKVSHAVAALADNGIILSISDFARLFAGNVPLPERLLKQAAQNLFQDWDYPDSNPYVHHGTIDSRYSTWAAKTASTHALSQSAVCRRAALAEIQDRSAVAQTFDKQASQTEALDEFGRQYGMYVLAALDRRQDKNLEVQLTATRALLQNHLSTTA